MIRRSTWIMLAIFIVAVGLVFYLNKYPIKNASVTPTATLLPPLMGNVTADKLTMVEFQSIAGAALQLKRNSDKTWGFTNIQGKLPDQGKVQELLFTITGLTVTEGFANSLTLDSTGLTTPADVITLQDESGAQNIIRIGAATSIASGYYVQLNKNNPVIIDKSTIDNLTSLFTEGNLVLATPTSETPGPATPVATSPVVAPALSPTAAFTPVPSDTSATPLSATATP
ncbi:MAG: hypothetical protein P4L50_14955 [Anaerolineaceae bacterium]|nr:hypothetical protein [Anaerolineaceae bacterium]